MNKLIVFLITLCCGIYFVGDAWAPTYIPLPEYTPITAKVQEPLTKKEEFINKILPLVNDALLDIENERKEFIKTGSNRDYLYTKYRTDNDEELLHRMDTVPVSMIISQCIIETGWGTSRFSKEANNYFGMWSYNKGDMVPNDGEHPTHYIKRYNHSKESIEHYLLTLNRLGAYQSLRDMRSLSDDPYMISMGLKKYSSRGDDYISLVIDVIKDNELTKYDVM
jgi:Bax protein